MTVADRAISLFDQPPYIMLARHDIFERHCVLFLTSPPINTARTLTHIPQNTPKISNQRLPLFDALLT